MTEVQRPARPTRPRLVSAVLTSLSAVLLVLALTAPSRVGDMSVAAFVRLPVELLVYVAIVLAIPVRTRRSRTAVAVVLGVVLGVVGVFKLLDVAFLQALNRPFDPLIDWRYAGSLVETVRGTGGSWGTVLLVGAGVVIVALLVLLPLSVLRVTDAALRHRTATVALVAALLPLWLLLSLLDVRAGSHRLASGDAAVYAFLQVSRVPSQLQDQREFAEAAATDPMRDVPAANLLTGLRGKDVLVVFVESYGRVAIEGSSFSPGVNRVLETGTRRLERTGLVARSAYLTSPTFGALSWLAHATLQSGLWVDTQQRYDHLVTSSRQTLTSLFGRAGWRTVAHVPANNRDWPQGAFYGFDHVYDSRNVGYRGPRFGYPTMPDQYTLEAFHRLELAADDRGPVMAEIDLITSHAPWSRTPRMLPQDEVGDGSVYEGMPETLASETDIWPSGARVRAAYGSSIEYSLRSVLSFLTSHGDRDLVVVLLGDHQPASIVSGEDPGYDVPITLIARDPDVTDRIAHWGWVDGLRPDADGPVWRMDAFRDRFVAAFGAPGHTGSESAGPRRTDVARPSVSAGGG